MRLMRMSNLLRTILSSQHMRHFVAEWLCNSVGDANKVCVTNCFATNGISLLYHDYESQFHTSWENHCESYIEP